MQRGGPWLFVLALVVALVLGGLASTVAWQYESRGTAAEQPPAVLPAPIALATVAPIATTPSAAGTQVATIPASTPAVTAAATPIATVATAAATPAATVASTATLAVAVTATRAATAAPTGQSTPPPPAATTVAPPPPGGNVANGRVLFQQDCNVCHPNGDKGVGPALHGAGFSSQFPTDASIAQIITNGRGAMPAFGSRLSAQQTTDIVAYLRSLP